MDNSAFAEARLRVLSESTSSSGIGTLSEKALHRILKLTVDADESHHEVKLCGSVADVYSETEGVTEIQTGAFQNLLPKLPKFFEIANVHVVYPLPYRKIIRWIDPKTGEISERRMSPKKGSVKDSFRELYKIRTLLCHPKLRLTLVFLDVEEYRNRDGYDKTGKRGSHRVERLPLSIEKEVSLSTKSDIDKAFLPESLPSDFTVKEFAKAHKATKRNAYPGIRILLDLGLIVHSETRGREYVYTKKNESM